MTLHFFFSTLLKHNLPGAGASETDLLNRSLPDTVAGRCQTRWQVVTGHGRSPIGANSRYRPSKVKHSSPDRPINSRRMVEALYVPSKVPY